jgi:integrase/recombinase XerD
MTDNSLLGSWIRRFLLEYLKKERNLAFNTQQSYRDVLTLLVTFLAREIRRPVDRLKIEDISANHIRLFLKYLEESRDCGVATRNHRLAVVHSLAHFIGMHCPDYIVWCRQIRDIPFKKCTSPTVPYLEKDEMDALLAAPDQTSAQSQRDYSLLLFLYNTGARADEAAHLLIQDLNLAPPASVRILGKGNKIRHCPLWPATQKILTKQTADREHDTHVFLNRCGQPITRFGIHTMVERYVTKVGKVLPSLIIKRVSPHTIRAWLGHVSLNTTNVYAEIDLAMKAKALAKCDIGEPPQKHKKWREKPDLMLFLRSL